MRLGEGKHVLVAAGDASLGVRLRRILERQGYRVSTEADGAALVQRLGQARPDLILAELELPMLGGAGLVQAVREDLQTTDVPVILYSARAGAAVRATGRAAGAADFLAGPLAPRELLARVDAGIRLAEVRQEARRALLLSEKQRRDSEDRLSLAVSTGRIAVFEWDVDTDRLIIDGSFEAASGADDRATTESTVTAFLAGVHPDDRDLVRAAVERGVACGVYEASYRLRGRHRERTVMARGEMRPTADGRRRMIGAVVDVTEAAAARRALEELNASLEERVRSEVQQRVRTEEALRQAQKMEVIGQLTGGVAHDFNNLLTVIMGGLDTIRRARPDDHQRIRRAADMALQGAQRAVSLTSRLLAFSRRQPLDPRPLDLNALVRDTAEMLQGALGEQIGLEWVLGAWLWRIEADQNQLASALLNLVVNARDAMAGGGKLTIETANAELDASCAEADVAPGEYVAIFVSDTGAGMSPDTLGRVFEPFFTTKAAGRGTGLGLSMVYGFVKQSGGHVAIQSQEGQGTTVRLYFPRYLGAVPARESGGKPSAASAGVDETILVVEDNEDVRVYVTSVLAELGYRVLEAADSEAALHVVRSDARIDLLFTDVVLPGQSGRVLATEAQRLRPGLEVLYATGYSRDAIVHDGRLDPGVRLITKPFSFEQLAARVRDAIDGREATG